MFVNSLVMRVKLQDSVTVTSQGLFSAAMQNPRSEISQVVKLLAAGKTPEIQQATLHKFFTPSAGFRHPICAVAPGHNSRESILGVYQWYRIMSPRIDLDVKSVSECCSATVSCFELWWVSVYVKCTMRSRILLSWRSFNSSTSSWAHSSLIHRGKHVTLQICSTFPYHSVASSSGWLSKRRTTFITSLYKKIFITQMIFLRSYYLLSYL